MGLDMYFYAKSREHVERIDPEDDNYKSFSKWRAKDDPTLKDETNYPEDLKELGDYIYRINFKSSFVEDDGFYRYQIGYFRKFNALHNYIVNELADGIDECQEIQITKDDLYTLLDKLSRIDNDRDLAEEELPTASGFFFGNTDYDDWYFDDVKDALEMCELYLTKFDFDKYDLIYHASW